MEIKDLQKNSKKIVNKIDEKYSINRDNQLTIAQLVEELGELAKEVNRKRLRNQEAKVEDLEEEFADVTLLLFTLIEDNKIDLEKAIREKIEVLKKRNNIE